MNNADYWNDSTARNLYAFLQGWLSEHPAWAWETRDWNIALRDACAVAEDLLLEIEMGDVNLAAWLRSPDGEMIQTVVGWILPWPQSAEFQLLVHAITLAAQTRQNNQRVAATVMFVVVALLAFSIVTGRSPRALSVES